MSGIYITGMDMPPSCWECWFQDCGNCVLNKHKVVDKCILDGRRDEDCPLFHVPKHGRLGDLDKLEQMFVDIDNAPYSGFDGSEPFYSAEDAAQIIRLSPTVIPATFENLPKSKDNQKIEEGGT